MRQATGKKAMLLVVLLTGSIVVPRIRAQARQNSPATATSAQASPTTAAPVVANAITSERQALSLRRLWGIDDVHVRSTASGSLIRFSYRVVDVEKAKILNSNKATPYLIDETHGLALQIPQLEQVGQLRQVSDPKPGREYWMAFSNKNRTLKPGDHVTVVIGEFRAKELVVESGTPARSH